MLENVGHKITYQSKEMFGNDSRVEIAVLQERFKAHEQIIEKVDTAIQTLSETNQNICKMLAVHDERIDQCQREDQTILEKVGQIEVKVEDLSKTKWMTVGIASAVALCITVVSSLASGFFTPSEIQMQTQGHTHSVQENKTPGN